MPKMVAARGACGNKKMSVTPVIAIILTHSTGPNDPVGAH